MCSLFQCHVLSFQCQSKTGTVLHVLYERYFYGHCSYSLEICISCELKSETKFQGKVLSGQVDIHTKHHKKVLALLGKAAAVWSRVCGKPAYVCVCGGGGLGKDKTKNMMKTKCSGGEGAPVTRTKRDRMVVKSWTAF